MKICSQSEAGGRFPHTTHLAGWCVDVWEGLTSTSCPYTEELYGDFEDLETGQVHVGDGQQPPAEVGSQLSQLDSAECL